MASPPGLPNHDADILMAEVWPGRQAAIYWLSAIQAGSSPMRFTRTMHLITSLITLGVALALPAEAATGARLPAPTSASFCVEVQKVMASTAMDGNITLFTDMPSYRHSKPAAEPFNIYQVVTYRGSEPVMVSCKMKTAAHLRAAYGPKAAGKQLTCPDVTRRVQAEAVADLRLTDPVAAAKAAAFVIDANEPYITGSGYLADFPLSYRAPDGAIHLNSPGLFQDYDSWITWFLPAKVQGQSYCHLPTVDYVKSLATGAMQPGMVVTTVDDAPVTPR